MFKMSGTGHIFPWSILDIAFIRHGSNKFHSCYAGLGER
jgi:hypothetical protein